MAEDKYIQLRVVPDTDDPELFTVVDKTTGKEVEGLRKLTHDVDWVDRRGLVRVTVEFEYFTVRASAEHEGDS